MTFIINLFSILWQVPSAISIIKTIMDIVGSDAVKQGLESIRDIVQRFQSDTPIDQLPQPERVRRFERLKLLLGKKLLNLSDSQFAHTMTACGRGSELQNA